MDKEWEYVGMFGQQLVVSFSFEALGKVIFSKDNSDNISHASPSCPHWVVELNSLPFEPHSQSPIRSH